MSASPDRQIESVRLAGGAAVSLAGKVCGRLLLVATQAVFARYLGMADFGRFSIGLTVLRILGIVSLMGFNRAAVVFGARYWRLDDARFRGVVVETLVLTAASGVIFGTALAALASTVSSSVFQSAVAPSTLRTFAMAVPFVALLRVASELSRVSQRMELGTLAEDIVQPVLALLLFLLLFLAVDGLDAAIWATTAGHALGFVFSLGTLLLLFPSLRSRSSPIRWNAREILVFSMPTALAIFCGAFTSTIDRLLVGRYCPPEQMALYQAASQVSVAFTIIVGSFSTIFAPMAARFLAVGDQAGLQRLFRTSTRWGLYLAMPVYLLVIVMPGEILALVFGEPYREGASPLILLASAQLVNVASGNAGVLLVTAGRQIPWLGVTFTATLLNSLAGVLLIPSYGLIGGAFGNMSAALVILVGGLWLAHKHLGVVAHDRKSFLILVASVAAYGACMLAAISTGWLHDLVRLPLVGAIAAVGFGLLVGGLGVDAGDKELWAHFRRRALGG